MLEWRRHLVMLVGSVLIAMGAIPLSVCGGEVFIDGLTINPSGWIEVADGIQMGVDHYNPQWVPSRQIYGAVKPSSDVPLFTKDRWSIKGTLADFDFSEIISKIDAQNFHYQVSIENASGVQTNQLIFSIVLPVRYYQGRSIKYGDHKILLPETYKDESIYFSDSSEPLSIPTSDGKVVIRRAKGIYIQDTRKYGDIYNEYTIRLPFSPADGLIKKSSIDLDVEIKPYQSEPIDISSQVNRGFEDDQPSDNQGGWTDQGPENDLRMFVPGRKRLGGVLFDVPDPKANQGKSCLVLRGTASKAFVSSASIPVASKTFKNLYLLHAIAWPPEEYGDVGRILVKYSDGDEQVVPVNFGRDVGNWWNALSVPNGDVVWTGENKVAYVGLYMSKFPVKSKAIVELKLEGISNIVWMVVGISGGEDVPRPTVEPPVYTVEGEEWKAYAYDLSVESGSAMDFSFLNDKPAGQLGRVIAKNGNFAFEKAPDTPVRFIGANLCFTANFLDKKACEQLAENLARMGYNSVRFHHIDSALADWADQSVSLNSDNLDKLDYLFYCCKSQGIYVTTDLFSCRSIPDTVLPELANSSERPQEFKPLISLNAKAMTNWENYTRNLLTHVNPYTGLAWKDDPALWGICVVNEDNLDYWWNQWPVTRELLQREYTAWCDRQKLKPSECDFRRFIGDCQLRTYHRCRDFIRSLGCQTLLTDVNMGNSYLTRRVRPYLDYVDNHTYASGPVPIHRYGALPAKIDHNSDITNGASLASNCFSTQIFDRPFVVTEFNQSFSNVYRAQSGLVMGAYGALQGWDGLYRFAYSHTQWGTLNVGATCWMELSQDPINLLSERIAVLLFRRGDVRPAQKKVPWFMSEQEIADPRCDDKDAYSACRRLGLRYQIGQWSGDAVKPADMESILYVLENKKSNLFKNIPERKFSGSAIDSIIKQTDPIISDTSQIQISPRENWMSVVTEKTECFAIPEKKSIKGKIVSIENKGKYCVVGISAIDKQPLVTSRHLLIFHLTDSSNTRTKYFDKKRTIILDWGILPHLVHKDSALIHLNLNPEYKISAWAITMSGKRLNEVPVLYRNGAFEIPVNTDQPSGGCMTYEVLIK